MFYCFDLLNCKLFFTSMCAVLFSLYCFIRVFFF